MSVKKRLVNFLLSVAGEDCRKEFNEQQDAYNNGEEYVRTWKTVLAAQERGLSTMSDVYESIFEKGECDVTAIEFARIIKEISELDFVDEEKELNISISKRGGNASANAVGYRVILPNAWMQVMGVDPDNRRVVAKFDGDKKIVLELKD